MQYHESNVNFRNLISDLTEMYTYDVSEVVITELVANALDAKATKISIDYDFRQKVLVVSDNGSGMSKEQFRKYHDLAAGLKTRGTGIGFAGVGAKISFNIAEKVITETRSDNFEGGSIWHLETNSDGVEKLVWREISPKSLIGKGSRIEVFFNSDAEIPYATTNEIIRLIERHYLPLLDKDFLKLYENLGYYSGLKFFVNGNQINSTKLKDRFSLEKSKEMFIEKSQNLIGYGILGLSENEYPLGEELCGILISVCGKIIKSELFNQFPGKEGPRIFGVVEVPGLITFLNTAKLDFIRPRGRNLEFENYYSPIRENFKQWLAEVGIHTQEVDINAETKKIERELSKIIEQIPELSEFFGFNSPRKVMTQQDTGENTGDLHEGIGVSIPFGNGKGGKQNGVPDVGNEPGESIVENPEGKLNVTPISRISKRGPKIAFVNAPEKVELAWVEGNLISINISHAVLKKIKGDYKEKRIFYLVAVGCAIQRFLVAQAEEPDLIFIDRILAAWGES